MKRFVVVAFLALGGCGPGFADRALLASQIVNSGPVSDDGPGIFRRSYVSGTNRICIYSRAGSEYVLTVSATDICPR